MIERRRRGSGAGTLARRSCSGLRAGGGGEARRGRDGMPYDRHMSDVLLVERKGAVATLTMNRPGSKNALNPELVEALGRVVPEVAADRSVRAVVLAGSGGAFSSGADLKSGGAGDDRPVTERLDQLHAVVRAIVEAPKAFVAAIDGA